MDAFRRQYERHIAVVGGADARREMEIIDQYKQLDGTFADLKRSVQGFVVESRKCQIGRPPPRAGGAVASQPAAAGLAGYASDSDQDDDVEANPALVREQKLVQQDAAISERETLLRERDEAIDELNAAVIGINELFRECARLAEESEHILGMLYARHAWT